MNTSKNEALPPPLTWLPDAEHYCVAYSGGVDSHVLLHLMTVAARARDARLDAVHVDHGLQLSSGDWAVHCRDVCEELGVPLTVLRVDAAPRPGESPEAAARHARYRALAGWLPAAAVLLTAQHRDDQAETLLLQLFRGAGPRGLASMPAETALGGGRLARPLLDVGRAAVLDYARRQRLRWIEDPSNADTRYDRNLLRRQLLPAIRQRWPGIDTVLARAASLQADQAELAAALGALDCQQCGIAGQPAQLDVEALGRLGRARQRNLLRHWIGANRLPLPAMAVLDRILDSVLPARADARPRVHWPGAEVRRFRGRLYLMPPLPPLPDVRFTWNLQQPLVLPAGLGRLEAVAVSGGGLRLPCGASLEVGFRRGGESLRPAGRGARHALKKLFQEWQVPDWERARVPLLFCDGALAGVAGYCVAEAFAAGAGEPGVEIRWRKSATDA